MQSLSKLDCSIRLFVSGRYLAQTLPSFHCQKSIIIQTELRLFCNHQVQVRDSTAALYMLNSDAKKKPKLNYSTRSHFRYTARSAEFPLEGSYAPSMHGGRLGQHSRNISNAQHIPLKYFRRASYQLKTFRTQATPP